MSLCRAATWKKVERVVVRLSFGRETKESKCDRELEERESLVLCEREKEKWSEAFDLERKLDLLEHLGEGGFDLGG